MAPSRSTTTPPNERCLWSRSDARIICLQARTQEENAPAAIYSLLETAKLNGINPEHHLRYVLTNIADHPVNRIAELSP
jgi:hypothetical protein